MLVGTKKDLRADKATNELAMREQEPIKVEDGHAMAEKIGACAYLECSAKLHEGVQEVFKTAACAVLPKKSKDCTML